MQPRAEGLIPKKSPVGEPRSVVSVRRPYAVAPSGTRKANAIRPYPTNDEIKEAGGHVDLPLLVLAHVRRMPFAPTDR